MATQLWAQEPEPVQIAASPEVLLSVTAPEVALAIWNRAAPAGLAASIDALVLDAVDDIEAAIEAPISAADLTVTLQDAGYNSDVVALLAEDIAALAGRFAAVVGRTRFKLRLEVIETDACRRFHSDFVTYRLLTTYRGQATQWIETDRPDAVAQMRAGEVAIFKGRMLLDDPPVLHRSPPIAATGEQRLLLVLDPVTE
ncbi:MAG: DUF1826 domain-containing protein [Sphingomonas sp.]|uniref:DUF1826 domain-containing protein n=1 Tax=Sphingomonas sp. TaxID=28214 RepID=UPI002639AB6B|nr:DUF1826 domain-containing protein [Sphingomonas sp.]MDK2769123.1 DUF1826 domain-containing protein [Sphingomonas sp.]